MMRRHKVRWSRMERIRRACELPLVLEALPDRLDVASATDPPGDIAELTPPPIGVARPPAKDHTTNVSPLFWPFLTAALHDPWSPLGQLGTKLGFTGMTAPQLRLHAETLSARLTETLQKVDWGMLRNIKDALARQQVRPKIEFELRKLLSETGGVSAGLNSR